MKQEIIRLWSACNQKCLFCNQEEIFDKKNKKQILFELLSFRKKHVEKLVISWGEPTLFKDELFFTIKIWKELWFKNIEIQSNAILLSNYSYVEELYNLGLNSALISLHSFKSDISDELTQSIWTFDKTLLWINNLLKIWISTGINIVINKKNYKNLLDYLSFIKKNIKWFNWLSLSVIVPWNLAIKNDLLPNYTDLSKYMIEAYNYCIKNKIYFQNPWCWIPVCFVKDFYKYSLEYQNYKSWNIYDELILEKNMSNKIKSEKCRNCILNKYCLWVWKWYVELYWHEELNPIIKL